MSLYLQLNCKCILDSEFKLISFSVEHLLQSSGDVLPWCCIDLSKLKTSSYGIVHDLHMPVLFTLISYI